MEQPRDPRVIAAEIDRVLLGYQGKLRHPTDLRGDRAARYRELKAELDAAKGAD
jgi:hypothetical protein